MQDAMLSSRTSAVRGLHVFFTAVCIQSTNFHLGGQRRVEP